MNALLAKHRPKGMEKDKFEEMWKNSHPQLQPLADVLKELRDREPSIRPDEFDCPNHYAKLVAELVKKRTLQDILDLLPDSVSK